jgi:hypothetical protein
MERVSHRKKKMVGYCLTGQSPQQAVVLMEEEELLMATNTILEGGTFVGPGLCH